MAKALLSHTNLLVPRNPLLLLAKPLPFALLFLSFGIMGVGLSINDTDVVVMMMILCIESGHAWRSLYITEPVLVYVHI